MSVELMPFRAVVPTCLLRPPHRRGRFIFLFHSKLFFQMKNSQLKALLSTLEGASNTQEFENLTLEHAEKLRGGLGSNNGSCNNGSCGRGNSGGCSSNGSCSNGTCYSF